MMQQPNGGIQSPMAPPPPLTGADQHLQQYAQHQPWMMMPHASQQPVAPPAGWTPQAIPPPFFHQQVQNQQYGGAPQGGDGEIKSLWIGDLQQWMDENYITNCFAGTGEAYAVKVIRNKVTGMPEGYGFVEFASRAAAERILQSYNGTLMPNSEQNFRLNWATLGAGERRQDEGNDFTIFVGDLASDVTDFLLQETFKAVYPSVKGAKIVTDRITGRSKGYGFVRFGDEIEQQRAMTEMNGIFCSNRAMRIGPAASKNPIGGTQQFQKATYQNTTAQGSEGETDPNNTTIFIGGLDPSVTDDHLKSLFGQYGELVHVKIPPGKRCGFVQFANRPCAEQALSVLNGTQIGGQSIRLSWGRSAANKQTQPDQPQYSSGGAVGGGGGGYYGYGQGGYETYGGYAPPPPQDPSAYYGGYPGYGNYQQAGGYQQPQQ